MSFETIQFRIADGVARLTLDRPDVLNSFNQTMHGEVRTALDAIETDAGCRVLLITGTGRGFCAGQDLSDRKRGPGTEAPDLGVSLDSNYNPLIRRLSALEIPVVCAVNGVAAGAGANIALACDIVLAARSARFVQSFARMGLVPDSGGTWNLPRLVGQARARALTLLAEPLSAEQAQAWGLIWRCVDDEELASESEALCVHFATQPTRGLALIKRALAQSPRNSLDEQLDLERDLQREAGRTEDYREAVAAFIEKRDPRFKGS